MRDENYFCEETEIGRNLPVEEGIQQISREKNNPSDNLEQFSWDGLLNLQHQPPLIQEKHKPT